MAGWMVLPWLPASVGSSRGRPACASHCCTRRAHPSREPCPADPDSPHVTYAERDRLVNHIKTEATSEVEDLALLESGLFPGALALAGGAGCVKGCLNTRAQCVVGVPAWRTLGTGNAASVNLHQHPCLDPCAPTTPPACTAAGWKEQMIIRWRVQRKYALNYAVRQVDAHLRARRAAARASSTRGSGSKPEL